MARKKSDTDTAEKKKIPAINFKCSAELKRDLEDLAHLSRRDVSSLLVEVATELVKANKPRIVKFRQQAGQPIKMPTCATAPSKTAAQLDTNTDAASVEGSGAL